MVDWAQFLLFHAPSISHKDLLIWLVGLVHLVFQFHRARPAAATTELQDRLREKGVVPELYTFSRFEQPCAVYVKLEFAKLNRSGYPEVSKDTSFCYIGSTNLTVAKREYNRVAKLKQLKQLKLPKTEIAIRYWHDKQNYELFSTSLLSQHSEYIDAALSYSKMAAQAELPLRYEGARQEGPWLGASAPTTSPTKTTGYFGQTAV